MFELVILMMSYKLALLFKEWDALTTPMTPCESISDRKGADVNHCIG